DVDVSGRETIRIGIRSVAALHVAARDRGEFRVRIVREFILGGRDESARLFIRGDSERYDRKDRDDWQSEKDLLTFHRPRPLYSNPTIQFRRVRFEGPSQNGHYPHEIKRKTRVLSDTGRFHSRFF